MSELVKINALKLIRDKMLKEQKLHKAQLANMIPNATKNNKCVSVF